MHQPITMRTLRDYAGAHRIHVHCPGCGHHDWLDLMRLAQSVGWDTDLAAVHAALKCSKCGSGGAQISIIHDGRLPTQR